MTQHKHAIIVFLCGYINNRKQVSQISIKIIAMLIYNVTIKIEWGISSDWVEWMKTVHIPEVMNSGCFIKHQFVRILEIDETDGPTYAVQYYADGLAKYNQYIQEFAPLLREKTFEKWGAKFIAFRSLMQIEE